MHILHILITLQFFLVLFLLTGILGRLLGGKITCSQALRGTPKTLPFFFLSVFRCWNAAMAACTRAHYWSGYHASDW